MAGSWPVRNSGSEQLVSAGVCCLCSIVEPASRSIPTAPRSLTMNSDGAIREPLTNREVAILELLAQRLQDKEIATRSVCFARDGEESPEAIFQKLDVHNRRDAAAIAKAVLATHSKDRAGHRQLTPLFPPLSGVSPFASSARSLRELYFFPIAMKDLVDQTHDEHL